MRSSDNWLQVSVDGCAGKRVRVANDGQLDTALFMWLSGMRSHSGVISDAIMIEKAKVLAAKLGFTEFQTNNSNRFLR